VTTIISSILNHALKKVFDQERPDHLSVLGHLHGIPLSGNRLDAFPSGHAVGTGLILTPIVLLAHWASDVVAGLAEQR
jgi:undecaprenyl-diphosphatase